ncbi:MAG: M48 family metalloprotease [Pirellulales bacterium]
MSVLAVVLALAWADLATPVELVAAGDAIGAMLGGQAAITIVLWCFSRRWLVRVDSGVDEFWRIAPAVARSERHLQLFGTLAALTLLLAVDWCHLVRTWTWAREIPLADDLLLLLPVLAPLLVGWGLRYDVERSLFDVYGAGTKREPRPTGRLSFIGGELRRQLGLLLVPLALLLTMQDVARLMLPDLLDGPHAGVFWLVAGAALFLVFPLTLRAAWETTRLPAGPLRRRLESLAAATGARLTDIRVLATRGGAANAAVAGPLRGLRYVFLTDSLLTRLTEDEIEAVFAHELGHVRHRHLVLRLAVGFAPCATWLAARDWLLAQAAAFPISGIETTSTVQVALGANPVDWCALALIVVATACGFVWCSRRWEHEADLFASKLLNRRAATDLAGGELPDGFTRFAAALQRLAVVNGQPISRGGWQHASLERRVEFLGRAAAWPDRADRFALHTRLVGSLLAGLAAGGFLVIGWDVVRHFALPM